MNIHGNISFSWNEATFVLIVKGPFNEEGIDTQVPLLKESVLKHTAKKWKRIEFWDMEVLGSPSTIKRCQLIWEWFNAHGCEKTAYVVSNTTQIQVLEKHSSSRSKIFLDKTEALLWLENN